MYKICFYYIILNKLRFKDEQDNAHKYLTVYSRHTFQFGIC